MNGLKFLLDTNIVIGLLKGHHAIIGLLKGVALVDCAYSAITRMELLSYPYLSEQETELIENLLAQLTYLSISQAIEDVTIKFRQQHHVKLPDAIIAATAKVHHLQLLTLDKKLANKL